MYPPPTTPTEQEKVATLFASGPDAHEADAPATPVPGVSDRAIDPVARLAGLPPASATRTRGWMLSDVPGAPRCGCWVKSSCEAGPGTTTNSGLVAPARPSDDAVREYLPVWSTAQPANNAEPLVTGTSVEAHVSEADAEPAAANATSTSASLPTTRLPPASSTATTGCCSHAVPPVPPPGEVRKSRWCAAPTETSNASVVSIAVGVPATVACSR